MAAPLMAVFDFQFPGRQYQPPAGDQTCLGYLICQRLDGIMSRMDHSRYLPETTTLDNS
jgi:hypothetical protein